MSETTAVRHWDRTLIENRGTRTVSDAQLFSLLLRSWADARRRHSDARKGGAKKKNPPVSADAPVKYCVTRPETLGYSKQYTCTLDFTTQSNTRGSARAVAHVGHGRWWIYTI